LNIQDADDGRADFLAGKKDEARYNDANNGADYRRGWQLARLGHIADQPKPEPQAVVFATPSDDPPWDDAPVVRRETAQSQPAAASIATSAKLEKVNIGENSPPPVTRQDVRLAIGEEKPKKSKPAPAGQLDLFG
jgi:hypothetical protein